MSSTFFGDKKVYFGRDSSSVIELFTDLVTVSLISTLNPGDAAMLLPVSLQKFAKASRETLAN